MVLIGGTAGTAAESKRDRKQIEEATRLQIFLDNSNFGPGKIDGKDGEFTRKAIALFKRSQGQADSGAQNSKTSVDTAGLNLASVDPVFATYVVTKGDIENVGELPSEPTAQAKVKWLPYQSVAEAIAEKFHCDINFLKELNPTITEKLKEGHWHSWRERPRFHRARCKSWMHPPCQLGRRKTGRDGETGCPGCCGVKIRSVIKLPQDQRRHSEATIRDLPDTHSEFSGAYLRLKYIGGAHLIIAPISGGPAMPFLRETYQSTCAHSRERMPG